MKNFRIILHYCFFIFFLQVAAFPLTIHKRIINAREQENQNAFKQGKIKIDSTTSFSPQVTGDAWHSLIKGQKPRQQTYNVVQRSEIIQAASSGDLAKVKSLIKQKVDIEQSNQYGETALIIASNEGHTNVVKYLLENGAVVEASNISGITSLMFASDKGNIEIVKLLLKKKANVNYEDDLGNTALLWAVTAGHTKIVKLLLEHGAQTSVWNNKTKYSPIRYALERNNFEIIKMLRESAKKEDYYTDLTSKQTYTISDFFPGYRGYITDYALCKTWIDIYLLDMETAWANFLQYNDFTLVPQNLIVYITKCETVFAGINACKIITEDGREGWILGIYLKKVE